MGLSPQLGESLPWDLEARKVLPQCRGLKNGAEPPQPRSLTTLGPAPQDPGTSLILPFSDRCENYRDLPQPKRTLVYNLAGMGLE